MTVEIFNGLGAKVRTANFIGNPTSVDLSGQAAGIHTVRISDGKENTAQHITLQ